MQRGSQARRRGRRAAAKKKGIMRTRDGRGTPSAETFDEKYSWSTVFARRGGKRTIYLRNIPFRHRVSSLAPSSSLGGENSAPLQLTIAIKILPWAPPYELRTLTGRLTFATLTVTSVRKPRGSEGSEDLVSTGDKRSTLQRARISFRERDDECIGIKGMSAAAVKMV